MTNTAVQPVRIQRSRRKGSKLESPNGLPVVCVSRGTKWGNPFTCDIDKALVAFRAVMLGDRGDEAGMRAASLKLYRAWADGMLAEDAGVFTARPPFTSEQLRTMAIAELRGKNLACWCKPGDPCHADVLLELARGSK